MVWRRIRIRKKDKRKINAIAKEETSEIWK